MLEFDMGHHIVLVTGAAGLLGEQHCAALLEAGATVIATDISKVALNELRDGPISDLANKGIRFEPLDVSNLSQVQELASRLQREKMIPTTLVNNAAVDSKVSLGGLLVSGRLEEFDEGTFVNEVSVDEQRHYAEDAGKSKEEIALITEPKKTYSFEADGVLLVQ